MTTREQIIAAAKEAGFKIFGNKIIAAENGSSGLATTLCESLYAIAFAAGAASRDAEIAELVEDKGRLDFLDGNSKFKMGWSVGQSPVGNLSISAVIQLGKEPTTIREAIDTALAKVRKPT